METNAALWSLSIAIFSLSVAVSCALVCWRAVSRCTAALKSLRRLVLTETSDAKLAAVQADQAELFSTLGKLTTTVTRLSSRAGMQDVRARRSAETSGEAPPPGTSKQKLREHYGLAGASHVAIAQRGAMSLVHKPKED